MPHIALTATLLTVLYAAPANTQPIALPLPVTVLSVELEGCAEVAQSSASCPLQLPPTGGEGTISGTSLVTNPDGKVEINVSGSASAVVQEQRAQGIALLTLEIEIPPDSAGAAVDVTMSAPRPVGTSRMEVRFTPNKNKPGMSVAFGDGFQLSDDAFAAEDDPPGGVAGFLFPRVSVVPELVAGDTVTIPVYFSLKLSVSEGDSTTFDETGVLEFKYLPAPEPPAESGLGAAVAFLLTLGAWRRRPR